MRTYLISYFREKSIEFREAGAGQFVLKVCPFCSDSAFHHFYMAQDSGLFDCKKCLSKGNFNQFRKVMGDSEIDLTAIMPKETRVIKKEFRTLNFNIPLEYASRLWALDTKLQDYLLNTRQLEKQVLEKFKIGSDGKNISIPLYEKDVLVSIQYRRNPEEDAVENAPARYFNEKGCKPVIFNGDILREPLNTVYITEGILDALQLIQRGFKNTVAGTLGAGYFSKEWVYLFTDVKNIVICYDQDQAGKDGAKKVAQLLGVEKCRLVNLPRKEGRKKTDITDYFVSDSYTKADFNILVKNAKRVSSLEEDSIKHLSEFNDDLRKRLLEGEFTGIPTGFKLLDEHMGGFRKGRLVILSGLTSSGKSSWVVNTCLRLAESKVPVFYFSLEMPPIDIAKKFLMLKSRLGNSELLKVPDDASILKQVDDALAEFKIVENLPLYLYSGSGTVQFKILQECSRIVKEEYGAEIIFVDHLHYFAHNSNNLTQETGQLIRDIKQLAMGLDITIVLLMHLNRAGRAQQKKGLYTPSLSDLRQSGVAEQDADQVLFVCRDSESDDPDQRKKAFLKIAKNRDGYAGKAISMSFNEDNTIFEELEGVDYMAEAKEEAEERGKEIDAEIPF